MNDKEYLAYEVVGSAEYLAAKVAATFPKEFAEIVRKCFASEIDAIAAALIEEYKVLVEQKEG